MKNYEELLKDIGIDIPEDKKEEFGKLFNENYKTIAEVEKLKTKLENSTSDNSNLTERLEQSQKDITELKEELEASGEDATKISELQTQVESLLKKMTLSLNMNNLKCILKNYRLKEEKNIHL